MYKKIYRSMCAMAVTTLLLSALIILCVCYTSFCARFTEQVKNECLFASSLLNAGKFTGDALESAVERSASKRISIISKDGSVLYDNNADASDTASSPETKDAFKKGFGEAQRRSKTDGKRYYYCAVKLNDGSVLKIGAPLSTASSMLATASMAVFFVAFLVFLTLVVIAKRLTENILLPFENIYSFDNTGIDSAYEEIRPFLKRTRTAETFSFSEIVAPSSRATLTRSMDSMYRSLSYGSNTVVKSVSKDSPGFALRRAKTYSNLPMTLFSEVRGGVPFASDTSLRLKSLSIVIRRCKSTLRGKMLRKSPILKSTAKFPLFKFRALRTSSNQVYPFIYLAFSPHGTLIPA